MQFLHEHKPAIIHRDLKTLNILIQGVGLKAKLADFGLARSLVGSFLSTMHVAGSPAWMAPEVLNGENVSTASDVYSFGVIMWEVATRSIPWDGSTYADIVREVAVLGKSLPKREAHEAWREVEEDYLRDRDSFVAGPSYAVAGPSHAGGKGDMPPLLGVGRPQSTVARFSNMLHGCMHTEAKRRMTFDKIEKELLALCKLFPREEEYDSAAFDMDDAAEFSSGALRSPMATMFGQRSTKGRAPTTQTV